MQRYWWPGYKTQLLAELQRQQNQTQFCDILLQTEGISVPAHSCILAALSPYLSQKLSASPSPLVGQKRQLQLQALKAQTLQKIVGLLYSGEVEVRRGVEQNEVLSAAHQLGILELVERRIDWEAKGVEVLQKDFQSSRDEEEEEGRERNEGRNMQDAEVQSDIAEGRAVDSLTEKRSCSSTDTETVATGEKAMGPSFYHFSQTEASNQDPASSSPQSPVQTQNTALNQHNSPSSVPPISSVPSGSNVRSLLDGSSYSVTNPTSAPALFSDVMAVSFSLDNDSNSVTPQESSTHQLSSERGTNNKMLYSREIKENTCFHTPRYEVLRAGAGCSVEERQGYANAKMRILTRTEVVQQMMEATQISVKVKLRRRTKRMWEVVNLQNRDETLAALNSLQQDDSNQKRPQTDPSNDTSPPSSIQPGSTPFPKPPILQYATTSTEPPPPLSDSTFDSQILSRDCFTPNQNNDLESVSLPQPLGPSDYSEEQIEMLLENVMTGLNILPILEKDSKRSHHIQPSTDQAATTCQIQLRESDGGQVQAGLAEYGCCQDFETQIGPPSTDADLIQPSCSSLLPMQPDAASDQQQQSSPLYQSITAMGQREEPNLQDMIAMTSVTPTSSNSTGQTLHHPQCYEQSAQEAQHIPEVSPLINGNQTPPCSFSLFCLEDFQLPLPPCLSPLDSWATAPEHQPSDLSLCWPAWLTEAPASLHFPLNVITHKENKSGSVSQTKNSSCQGKKDLKLVRKNRGTLAELYKVKEKATTSTSCRNVAERKSIQEMEEGGKCKQSDTKKDAEAPKKRECASTLANCPLSCKKMKVSDGTSLNLSVCSVSLSSNNVLFREREMNTSFSSKPVKLSGKPSEPPTITDSQKEKARGPLGWLLEKVKETPANPSPEHASETSVSQCQKSVSNPKRKRGRPPKIRPRKSPESPPAVMKQESDAVEVQSHTDNHLSNDNEEEDKIKRKYTKRRWNRSKGEVGPPKKTSSAESSGTTETDINHNMRPAGSRPKRCLFQKLLQQQPLKTRQSKANKDKEKKNNTNEAEGERKAPGSECEEVTAVPHESTVEVEESHSRVLNKSSEFKSQRNNTGSSTPEVVSLSDQEQHSVFSLNDLGEEVEKLAAQMEPTPTHLHEAQACDGAVSDASQCETNSDSSSHSDPHRLQGDSMSPDHNVNHETSHRPCLPLMDSCICTKIPGCAPEEMDKEEEEEEEEKEEVEEVDVLLFSPDIVPKSRSCENGLENVDTGSEKEEDEDAEEVDVTGDESE